VNGVEAQAATVILWLLALKVLQLSIYPMLRPILGGCAYPLSYPVSLLSFTLLSWYAGLFHLPVSGVFVVFLALMVVLLVQRRYEKADLRRNLVWDGAFLIGFFYLLEIRFFNPAISFAEKFMDHAFLASIMRMPIVPPLDPWFAGGDLSIYYYLGHWMSGALGVVIGAESSVVFNLMLPTTAGLAVVSAVALGSLLLPKYSWLPVIVLILPNPAVFWHLISATPLSSIPWESTRVIAGTINEYPVFSFFWGDPHAHILGIFNQILFVTLCILMYLRYGDLVLRDRLILSLLLALSLGTMPGLNSWDVLVYAPVFCLFALATGIRYAGRDLRSWLPLLLVPPLSLLCYAPLLLSMKGSGILGIGCVPEGSEIVSFLLVHGFFLLVLLIYGLDQLRRFPWLLAIPAIGFFAGYGAAGIAFLTLLLIVLKRGWKGEDILAIAGLSVIIFCEFIYLRDNMGEVYYRMNTVFKLSMTAWIMMGMSAMVILGQWLSRIQVRRAIPSWAGWCTISLVVLLLILIPPYMPLTYGYPSGTLDGAAWLSSTHPGDAAAIAYLRSLNGEIRIVEAIGDDYTYAGRISSFTGIPTVLGWPGHELVWRSNEDGWYNGRIADVRVIYENPDRSLSLLSQYGITHLIVGSFEEERYSVQIPEKGLENVFEMGGTAVYQVMG
jgi:YYY domain-containing protein